MLRICSLLIALSTYPMAFASHRSIAPDTVVKPNTVFILADDLGYGDVGSYTQGIIRTPHINALTERGMKFSYNCKHLRESGSGIIDINKGNIEHKSTYSLLYFCSAKHLF